MGSPDHLLWVCRYCGRTHRPVALRRGERALCIDCGTTLSRHSTSLDAALAFTITGLILLFPALRLPVVIVRKFGIDHTAYIWSGTEALWQDHMHLLSIWVALCGLVVPILLLVTIAVALIPARYRPGTGIAPFWRGLARSLQNWSIPEVQILAVFVAFVKIGVLVQVDIGPGLWFYGAMAVMTLLAWRQAEALAPLT